MSISVIGSGAFGTALAITWAQAGHDIILWGRDVAAMERAEETRHTARLPDAALPQNIACTAALDSALQHDTMALALPAQALRPFLETHATALEHKTLIACCKGIDLTTMTGPVSSIENIVPNAVAAMLTGPSFAADIAKGLPTALTLATKSEAASEPLQALLSTQTLRLYRSSDTRLRT